MMVRLAAQASAAWVGRAAAVGGAPVGKGAWRVVVRGASAKQVTAGAGALLGAVNQ